MPASIHSTSEVPKLLNAAPISSPSPSSSTITCDSIKTIEAWLDTVEEPDVTVIVKELGKASQDPAQEPEAKNPRKRKHSSSLTEENLSQSSLQKRSQRLLQLITDYEMAGNALGGGQLPLTPGGSSANGPTTPTPSTKSKTKVPTDSGWVSRTLGMHGLKCEDGALARYPDFEKMVSDIALSKRHSEMKPESVELFEKYNKICQAANEATFLDAMLPLILKTNRTVKEANHGLTEQSLEMSGDGDTVGVPDPQPRVVYGSRHWVDDGVWAVSDQDFRKDLLPHHYVDDQLAQAMKKDDSMLTPRPDRCYGLGADWISVPNGLVLDTEIRTFIEACPALSHPFFLIEGKSNKGDRFAAMLQARRGGASLVNAMRQLLAKIGEPHVTGSGVDTRNFVYSATLFPDLIKFWVHWVELDNGTPVFHMNMIESFALQNKRQIPEVRKVLNNIMSWGCDLKERRLTELHEKIYTWQRKEKARLEGESQQREAQKAFEKAQKEAERKEKAEQTKKRPRTG